MDDRWLKTPLLVERMSEEANFGPYWAVSRLTDGTPVFDKSGPIPEPPEQMFIADMATALNRHLAHDGRWVVALTHPATARPPLMEVSYRRFYFMFLDADGDPQLVVDNEEPWWRVLTAKPDRWIEQCQIAWQAWHNLKFNVLDPRENETFKAAQGQRRPSLVK